MDTALRVQVLAVVFVHFILSGILALEAKHANVVQTNGNAQSSFPELFSWCTTARSTRLELLSQVLWVDLVVARICCHRDKDIILYMAC